MLTGWKFTSFARYFYRFAITRLSTLLKGANVSCATKCHRGQRQTNRLFRKRNYDSPVACTSLPKPTQLNPNFAGLLIAFDSSCQVFVSRVIVSASIFCIYPLSVESFYRQHHWNILMFQCAKSTQCCSASLQTVAAIERIALVYFLRLMVCHMVCGFSRILYGHFEINIFSTINN